MADPNVQLPPGFALITPASNIQLPPGFKLIEQTPEVGNFAAGAEGLAQGVTLGFSDEIEGGARALYGKLTGDKRSIGDLYDEGVAIPRARVAAAKDSNPVAFYAGDIGGSLIVPGGLARAGIRGSLATASNLGLGARSLAAGKEAAAYGAATGAGTAEGWLPDRLTGAVKGAVIAGPLGALAPGAVDLAGAVATRATTPIRAAMNPRSMAAEKLSEAIYRDMSVAADGAGIPAREAARFANKFATMSQGNPQARVMDAGGENVHGIMRAAVNVPNQARAGAKRALDARAANQYARLESDLKDAFGIGDNYHQSIAKLAQNMDEIGNAAIQPALRTETKITPKLAAVLERPTMQELQSIVARKIADEGRPINTLNTTEFFHRMKLELDDQIGIAVRAQKMGNKPQAGWDKGTLTTLWRDFMNAIDNPEYKHALKQYAGQAKLMNAAEDGFEHFTKAAPEEITAAIEALGTGAERMMYRLGAQRAVIDKVRAGNANLDRTDGVFGSPLMQMKLRAVLPDSASFREFQKKLVIEAKMADSRKALQGNSTTAKQLAEGEQAGKASRVANNVMNALTGKLEPALNLVAQGYNRFTGMTPAVANELLTIGMSRDPAMINALADYSMRRAAQTPVRRAGAARLIDSAIGGRAGDQSPPRQSPWLHRSYVPMAME